MKGKTMENTNREASFRAAVAAAAAAVACICCAEARTVDLHPKSLTPIAERERPAGGAMDFVKGGRLNVAIVADAKAHADAVGLIAKAFEKTTLTRPEVLPPDKAGTMADGRYLVLVGDHIYFISRYLMISFYTIFSTSIH